MADSRTESTSDRRNRADTARASRRSPVGAARAPVERLLPTELIAELQCAVRAAPEVTPKLGEQVDRRFDLTRRYGITRRRLLHYLRRLHRAHAKSPEHATSVVKTSSADGWREKLSRHRMRQASVGSILDAMFGPLARCRPESWERRAYWMLVGLVYERLATGERELPTDELVAFAKVLAENRRVEARLREAGGERGSADAAPPGDGDLPEKLSDVVRQLYGTNLQQPDPARDDGASGTPVAREG